MKKVMIAVCTLCFIGTVTASNINDNTNEGEVIVTPAEGGRYTILNDTDEKVKIHTGYGTTTLNPRGGRTSVSCEPGKKVKIDGKVIYEVSDDMCGETVKLSDYL